MGFSIKQTGTFKNVETFIKYTLDRQYLTILNEYGSSGVAALSASTPKETGETASSWYYKITKGKNRVVLSFHNDNIEDGVNIAVILQYGHATRNGGWVDGIDYINPVVQPLFTKIANDAWGRVVHVQ